MTFEFAIPGAESPTQISIEPGESAIFVGANGSGKTRLAVYIEEAMGENAHRISAHRALSLNPGVPKIRGEDALRKLRYGWEDERATIGHRRGNRWPDSKPAVAMLNDFDSLIQALFAEQSVTTLETHKKYRTGTLQSCVSTKFEILADIWQRLLPRRQLDISGDDIRVAVICTDEPCASEASDVERSIETYSASEMSDGERAIFYLIAQALVAAESSLLVIDEPELHVHPSIMSNLWDEIEAARPDCGFLFITHDLNFAANRSAEKYVIKSFAPAPSWVLEVVPKECGFSEEVATLILGSRRPILFVEGSGDSLDIAVYRRCYPQWTVIPRGSCEQVVQAVVTMRANAQLTRVKCAGIVDADDYSDDETSRLNGLGVFSLPVSEIENIFLLPQISCEIAKIEGYEDDALAQQLANLNEAIFGTLRLEGMINEVVLRYCRRRIDRCLKKIDLSEAASVSDLVEMYSSKTADLDIALIAGAATRKIENALANQDLPKLLTIYDNKGLLALAAQHLKQARLSTFEAWLTRMMRDERKAPNLVAALNAFLPRIQAS